MRQRGRHKENSTTVEEVHMDDTDAEPLHNPARLPLYPELQQAIEEQADAMDGLTDVFLEGSLLRDRILVAKRRTDNLGRVYRDLRRW